VAHVNRLAATFRPKRRGWYNNGGGLYLQVTEGAGGNLNQSWVLRFALGGKDRYMGLGAREDVPIAVAREKRREYRQLIKAGIDPIRERNRQKAANLAAATAVVTFDQAADDYISLHESSWKNAKHVAQWRSTLRTYASPIIGKFSVADITLAHIMRILKPIWTTKPETASRVRGRIEQVLDSVSERLHR